MTINTKRWNDLREAGDGLRLLVCRYRPRGLPRREETWDAWRSELGPSRKLHAELYGKHGPPLAWEEFRSRYLEEVKSQTALIDELAAMVRAGKRITLLCSSACTDPAQCHRTLLKGLIESR